MAGLEEGLRACALHHASVRQRLLVRVYVCMNSLRKVAAPLFQLPPVTVERAQEIMSPGAVEDV